MSGQTARKGFYFQDLYLLLRVLRVAGATLEEVWTRAPFDAAQKLDAIPYRFGLEASPRTNDAGQQVVDWDVLVGNPEMLELAEVKSGAVDKEDRLVFWRRLRRELSTGDAETRDLAPLLVVDPDRAGDLEKWQNLVAAVRGFALGDALCPPESAIVDSSGLLREALWCICGNGAPADFSIAPVSVDVAVAVLNRFSIHAHRVDELEREVRSLLGILFPDGMADSYEPLLRGWLDGRARSQDPSRRLFSIRELLAEVGVLGLASAFSTAKLHEWRELWEGASVAVKSRTRTKLGRDGRSIPVDEIQPSAVATLYSPENRAVVVRGPGGSGKSTFLAQAVAAAEESGELVLWCGADDVSIEEAEQLTHAFRFRAGLAALRQPGTAIRLIVDGLDESPPAIRKRWVQLLVRLINVPNARLLVSVRESIWRTDGNLPQQLGTWAKIDLGLWPESFVRQLLAGTAYAAILPASAVELLRTPILLDLFWRTFVEGGQVSAGRALRLQSRHAFMATFWEERLLRAPRYEEITDRAKRLTDLFAKAASSVGAFVATDEDKPAIDILLAEGVVVEEGRLQSRLIFRHPLLRDFAFSQWCLSTGNEAEAARRWNAIAGGIQRFGALRAIAEALMAPEAMVDYEPMTMAGFLRELVKTNEGAADQVAQFLGMWEPLSGTNPGLWRPDLKAVLPSTFGSSVLIAARLNENLAWAAVTEHWGENESWIDDNFAYEVWHYADWLRERSTKGTNKQSRLEAARPVARKLRILAQHPRFASQFAKAEGWLTMQAVCCALQTIPDLATLEWVEREIANATWRTRSFVLEHLIHLAAVDAERTAGLFRSAIGLTTVGSEWQLRPECWRGIMSEQVLEWSLWGKDMHRGLLREYPAAFFPVAVDLAEALYHIERKEHGRDPDDFIALMEGISPGSAAEMSLNGPSVGLGDLIDDSPGWSYWHSYSSHGLRERCVCAIHEHAKTHAENDYSLFAQAVAPTLRRSRLATIQSVLVDILIDHTEHDAARGILREAATDARLYYASGLDYWLEQNLVLSWTNLNASERDMVQTTIGDLLRDEKHVVRAKSMLARLAPEEWQAELRPHRPADGDPEYQPSSRPCRRDGLLVAEDVSARFARSDDDEDRQVPGQWPEAMDLDVLLVFSRAARVFDPAKPTVESMQAQLSHATTAAINALHVVQGDFSVLIPQENSWFWQALAATMDLYRAFSGKSETTTEPPTELIQECGHLAFHFLRDIPTDLPGKMPEKKLWSGFRETVWTHALDLADEALTWPPLANDNVTQAEFVTILETAFATRSPMMQLICGTRVRSWHWLRKPERRALFQRLVWEMPTDPTVLQWSLVHCSRYDDAERTRTFRLILQRSDLKDAGDLSHELGEYVGNCSLLLVAGGRSATADLTREIVAAPNTFPLLEAISHIRAFWGGFVFGLKERATHQYVNAELAPDYGFWVHAAWRALSVGRQRRNESEAVVLHAMHWIERKDPTAADGPTLFPWWESILPLLESVARDGDTPDCFYLFFNLRDGEFNHVARCEDVMHVVEVWSERIVRGAADGTIDLDARDTAKEMHHSWRECAEFAASSVDALSKGGLLKTDLQRDRAHRLLATLAASPIRSPNAVAALHRLQQD